MKYFNLPIFIIFLLTTIIPLGAKAYNYRGSKDSIYNAIIDPKDSEAEFTKEFLAKDFAPLLMPETEFLGYIGNNFQRLYVEFTSIEKDLKDPSIYHVKGNSLVKKNKQNFSGEIKITEINGGYFDFSRNKETEGRDDLEGYIELKPKAYGMIIAKYEFRENQKEPHSGKFSGEMQLNWLLGKNYKFLYDNVGPNDDYSNNQYYGTWISYRTKISKKANWGEHRIPESQFPEYDFDTGAAEFNPNPKYEKQGWPQNGK